MNPVSPSPYDGIADGLADKGYASMDHFLSPAEAAAVLAADEYQNGLLQFRRAGTGRGRQIAEGVRGDYIQWISRHTASPPVKVYLDRIDELIRFLNRALFLSLKDYEIHATVYPVGSFYRRHLDQFKATDNRKLSVICYLNPGWKESEGGQLRMYPPGEPVDVFPEAGRLICFRSDQLEHEVLPAVRERCSLTGWILDRQAENL